MVEADKLFPRPVEPIDVKSYTRNHVPFFKSASRHFLMRGLGSMQEMASNPGHDRLLVLSLFCDN